MKCLVCESALGDPVYSSPPGLAVSSLARVYPGQTRVRFCRGCGHAQSDPLPDSQRYYDEHYNILADYEDEDNLYAIQDGQKIFQAEHQFNTLVRNLELPKGCRLLDYGCGKSPVVRRLTQARPDVVPHLFDVSDAYVSFWERFVPAERWACYEPKAEWSEYFDVVVSFFALEHCDRPRGFVESVAKMLKPGGTFYFLVPNVFEANWADLFVIDHVSHFSPCSLGRLLSDQVFEILHLDARAHDQAYLVIARKSGKIAPPPAGNQIEVVGRRVKRIADYWSNARDRIRDFERAHPGPASIYGAGACGCFIATCLENLDPIRCFIDQNPHKQGKKLGGKPIVSPEAFGDRRESIYVGLNPRRARSIMDSVPLTEGGDRFFL